MANIAWNTIFKRVPRAAKVFTRKELTKRLVKPVRSDWKMTARSAMINIFWTSNHWSLSVRDPSISVPIAIFPIISLLLVHVFCMVEVTSARRLEAVSPYLQDMTLKTVTQKSVAIIRSDREDGSPYLLWMRWKLLFRRTEMGRRFLLSMVMILLRMESSRRFR